MIEELVDKLNRKLDELTGEMRGIHQRVASLDQDARQSRLALEADGPADSNTRECMEDAVTAVQAIRGDSFSASRVDPDSMCPTSFGVKAEPSTLPCRDYALIENCASAPKPCLSPLGMPSSTAAGGLLLDDITSIATRINFNQPTLRFNST